MQWLKQAVLRQSQRARARRGELFRKLLQPTENDKILDLGGGDGSHIASILPFRKNVTIADIDTKALKQAEERFGFQTVLISESGQLLFPDQYFDIVFCSSVIEHVTIPKAEIYLCRSGHEFARRAFESQQRFAQEIRRLAKHYFVQTPHKYFLLESHTWLPMPAIFLPRPLQIKLIQFFNRFWIKHTDPDWHLLTPRQMRCLFPDAQILIERWYGLPKSIIACKPRTAVQHSTS